MENLIKDRFLTVKKNKCLPMELTEYATKKIQDYVYRNRHRYKFYAEGLGSIHSIYFPIPIISIQKDIPTQRSGDYIYVATDLGLFGVEKDFFKTFFNSNAPLTIQYINHNQVTELSKAFMVFIHNDGSWSVG